MKKNGEYVGVDEKYIPEEEKYVDNTANSEIKDVVNQGVGAVKDYITDKDNQEKIKNTGRKGLKILKGVGIGYAIFAGFVILFIIGCFIAVICGIFNGSKNRNDYNNVKDNVDNAINEVYSKNEVDTFNMSLELYSGTKYGSSVTKLFDEIIKINKTKKEHTILVIYNDTTTSNSDEIRTLKDEFQEWEEYEVSLDYDTNGFVNKVTIYN